MITTISLAHGARETAATGDQHLEIEAAASGTMTEIKTVTASGDRQASAIATAETEREAAVSDLVVITEIPRTGTEIVSKTDRLRTQNVSVTL